MSKRQTKEQERAAYAWKCVEEAQNALSEKASEYGQLARGLPALIQTNGLGQTLAYLLAKGKHKDAVKQENPHHLLYSHLSRWVMKEIWQREDSDGLLVKLTQESSANYRRATSEAMALLIWLRRFAEARLVKEEANDGQKT